MAPTLRSSRKPVPPVTNVPAKQPRRNAKAKPKPVSSPAPVKTKTKRATRKRRGMPHSSQTEDERELMAMARDENEGIMITSTPNSGSRRKHQVNGKAKAKILLPKTVFSLEDSISDIEAAPPVSKRPRRQDSQREDVQVDLPARRAKRSTWANPQPEEPIVAGSFIPEKELEKGSMPMENTIPKRTTVVKVQHTRRLKETAVPMENFIPETTTLEKARNLLAGTCKVFRVGQLYNLEDVSETGLANLRTKLVKHLRNNLGMDARKYEFDAKFSIITDLPKTANDPDSMYVEVTRTRPGRPNTRKAIFLGLFASCGSVAPRFIYQNSENGVKHLPICIANSRDKYMKVVKEGLTKLFGCPFLACELGYESMVYMAGSWMSVHGNDERQTMNLVCSDIKPLFLHNLRTVFYLTVRMDVWVRQWALLLAGRTNEQITWTDIDVFWRTVMTTVTPSVPYNEVKLNKILLPEMVFTSDGKIKAQVKGMPSIICVLSNLTRIFEHFAIQRRA